MWICATYITVMFGHQTSVGYITDLMGDLTHGGAVDGLILSIET